MTAPRSRCRQLIRLVSWTWKKGGSLWIGRHVQRRGDPRGKSVSPHRLHSHKRSKLMLGSGASKGAFYLWNKSRQKSASFSVGLYSTEVKVGLPRTHSEEPAGILPGSGIPVLRRSAHVSDVLTSLTSSSFMASTGNFRALVLSTSLCSNHSIHTGRCTDTASEGSQGHSIVSFFLAPWSTVHSSCALPSEQRQSFKVLKGDTSAL